MSESNTDDIKGRAKEAAGAVTNDEDLKEEGRNDQRAADAKEKVENAADKVKDGIDDVKDRITKN
jgi:uncharacterized protein YjbJ (UPF0337 family)